MRTSIAMAGFVLAVTALPAMPSGQTHGMLEQRHLDPILAEAAERGSGRCRVSNLDEGNASLLVDETLYRSAQQPVRDLQILNGLMRHQQGQVLQREFRTTEAEAQRIAGLSRSERARLPEGRAAAVEQRYRQLQAIFNPADVQAQLEQHAAARRGWIADTAQRIAALPPTADSWAQLARFDARWLEPYVRECSAWNPYNLRTRFTFEPVDGKADLAPLNTAILAKYRDILNQPGNAIEREFLAVQGEQDYPLLFNRYIIANASNATQALDETGLLQFARDRDRAAYEDRRRRAAEARELASRRRATAAQLARGGFSGWLPAEALETFDVALMRETEVDGITVQTTITCAYGDPSKTVILDALVAPVEGEAAARAWSTSGSSRAVPLTVEAGQRTLRLNGRRLQDREGRTLINQVNVFQVAFVDRAALATAQSNDPIGALYDWFTRAALNAGLASRDFAVEIGEARDAPSYVLSGAFEAEGQAYQWRSPDIGGASGPVAVLYDACHL